MGDFLIVCGLPWIIIGIANYIWITFKPWPECSAKELNLNSWPLTIIGFIICIVLGPVVNLIWLKLKYDKWMFS